MVMHGFSRGVKDVEGDPATAGSGVPRALPDISGSFGPAGGDAARRVAGIKQNKSDRTLPFGVDEMAVRNTIV